MTRIALATTLALLALTTGVAGAATVNLQDSAILVRALAGEQNELVAFPSPSDGTRVRIAQQTGSAAVTAGFGCTQVDSRTVDCPRPSRGIDVDLGDLGDTFEMNAIAVRLVANGGDGNDTIVATGAGNSTLDGGNGDDRLSAATGTDTLRGGPGQDILRGDVERDSGGSVTVSTAAGGADTLQGGPETDSYSGGPGADIVSYVDAPGAVTASLAEGATGGAPVFGSGADNEQIPEDIEGLTGGRGNDTLTGNEVSNRIQGGDGADTLTGKDASDNLSGGAGGDKIFSRDGHTDLISCGANGSDRVSGGGDRLDSDLADGTPPSDCEFVDQGALNEGKNVRMAARSLRAARDRRVAVRLRCPADVTIGCRGRLRLSLLSGSRSRPLPAAASRRYALAAGAARVVRLRLSRRMFAALRRRARSARLRSVETGEFGPKTTIATVRLRAR